MNYLNTLKESFMKWTLGIRPEWAGFIIFFSTILLLIGFAAILSVVLIIVTKGLVFLIIPAFVAYAWYLAIFKQEE